MFSECKTKISKSRYFKIKGSAIHPDSSIRRDECHNVVVKFKFLLLFLPSDNQCYTQGTESTRVTPHPHPTPSQIFFIQVRLAELRYKLTVKIILSHLNA